MRRDRLRGGDHDRETCELCGEPRPPGSTVRVDGDWLAVCPACEDQALACPDPLMGPTSKDGTPPESPPGRDRRPHGNTTR